MKASLRLRANLSFKEMSSEFEADYNAVRHQLAAHEMHEPTQYGSSEPE
jgi:hypothetical protein